MTDQTIPADLTPEEVEAAREWAERSLTLWDPDVPVSKAARVVLAVLPAPPRPTLADMTDEERAACRWMQADVYSFDRRMVITEVRTMCADLIDRDGERWNVDLDRVTPRPDLRRMEWPANENAAPAPSPALPGGWRYADHKDHGRVIVTTQTPNDDGRVYFVLPVCRNLMGFDWRACDPDELTYLDQGGDTHDTALEDMNAWRRDGYDVRIVRRYVTTEEEA